MEKKMTEKELYGVIMGTMADNADVVEFCQKKIAQLEKKSANKKAKALSEQEVELMANVQTLITDLKVGMTVTDIVNKVEVPAGMERPSTPKVTSILKKLGATKTVVKGRPYFKISTVEVAVELDETETETEVADEVTE
jgi:hypothetical protein